MKLTKKATRELEAVLRGVDRARDYIMNDRIAVCRRDKLASTALHYTRDDNAALLEVAKEYGSDLCMLGTAQKQLLEFIASHGAQ